LKSLVPLEEKPVHLKEIARILLEEKGYVTRSEDFENQLRASMYSNKKGDAMFGLA